MNDKVTRCTTCGKILALNETAWACGPLFCSHECGVNWAKTKYEANEYEDEIELHIKATAYFNDIAEEISREEYGARTEYFTAYSAEHDISSIFEQIFEGDELISETCVGWYYGAPSAKYDEEFIGKLTASYVD